MSTAAAVVEKEIPTGIIEFNQFESDLAEYKLRYEKVVYDLTVPAQEKQARSDRLSIGKKVAELDRVHAAVKAPLKAQVDLLDGERKRIKDGLLAIQEGIKAQIAEHEAKVQEAENALLARVEAIKALAEFEFPPTSDQVMSRMVESKKVVIDDSFAHHEGAALIAHRDAQSALTKLYGQVSQAEADAAELARLKAESEAREQKEREDRIAAEAAAKAQREAEEAAIKAKQEADAAIEAERQAKLKAEQDAHDAINRERLAKEQAEQLARDTAERAKRQAQEAAERAEREKAEAVARAEAEAKTAAERVEKARLDAIEQERIATEKRKADQEHREEVDGMACAVLIDLCNLSPSAAKAIIAAIASDLVPNVKIHY